MPRYFIALNLPPEIKTVLKQIQDNLKQKNQDVKITWVKPEISHLNLHFLGDLSENVINQLKQDLKALQAKFGPFSLVLTGVGAFPGLKNPRILFLGVKHIGKNNLIKIYNNIKDILNNIKIYTEDKPYIAHVTLGRIKESNKKIIFTGEETQDIEFKINSFELMASTLTSDGPIYDIVESYEL